MEFQILLSFLFLLPFLSSSSSDPPLCNPHDYIALVQFNNSLSLHPSASVWCDAYLDDSYSVQFKNLPFPKTTTWQNDSNCCLWEGVTCNSISGHVIGLDLSCSWLHGPLHPNSSLFQLRHLQTLNLAYNEFSGSSISSQFGDLPTLTHLNLSYSSFTGEIPPEIAHLSNLVSLDLSWNQFDFFERLSPLRLEPSTWEKLILNMTDLKELVLDHVNMSSITPNSMSLLMNLSSSLVHLKLQDTGMQGMTNRILCLQNLQQLDLSSNKNLNGQLPKSNWSSHLTILDLSVTAFSGKIPNAIGQLKYLNYLSLANSQFEGPIPQSFKNLTHLTYLNLASNKFSGEITFFSSMGHLMGLSLDSQITLRYCDLSNNKFEGDLPESIFGLTNLSFLSLSSNNMSGLVHFHQFSGLQNLRRLDLSNNKFLSLSFDENVDYTIPNLQYLNLSYCNINSLPKLSEKLQKLESLYLSNNKIHGKVPKWFNYVGNDSLYNLDLSHNFLTSIEHLATGNISFLDLSNNMLQGKIPKGLNNVANGHLDHLDLSHNNLTSIEGLSMTKVSYLDFSFNMLQGSIPPSLCKVTSLVILNFSHNNLSGFIPQCLVALPNLSILDLQMNDFSGTLPNNFLRNNVLKSLHLNNNQLKGSLPLSLARCNQLEILDVGHNEIGYTFPSWLDDLPELQVLVLRENKFYGVISSSNTKHPFPNLRIFYISSNHFNGSLPVTYIKEFKGMMETDNVQTRSQYMESNPAYKESVMITWKDNIIKLERILTIFTTIDLSNNKFDGEIPKAFRELHALIGLNLSHNRITGSIPKSIGTLTNLESLDLSCNNLIGEIPQALTNLNFLAILNLSQNQLEGTIPRGNQFDTFQRDSYEGNLGLCGAPLSKSCNTNEGESPTPSSSMFDSDEKFGFGWKPVALGYGCGTVFGILMGYLVFSIGKPQWLVRTFGGQSKKQAKRTRNRAHANRRMI